MKIKLFALILICILLISCNNENSTDNIFYWDQTGCSDPWDVNENFSNSDTLVSLSAYLESEGVIVLNARTERTSEGPFCFACSCTTGLRIFITISETDNTKAESLGFIKL